MSKNEILKRQLFCPKNYVFFHNFFKVLLQNNPTDCYLFWNPVPNITAASGKMDYFVFTPKEAVKWNLSLLGA